MDKNAVADMSSVVVAVLGTGSIGSRHIEVLNDLNVGRVIAVPKRSSRLIEWQSSGYCTANNLTDAVEQGARACIIASSTGQHIEDGLEALELGLDILMEKPLAVDAKSAKVLQKKGEELGRKIFVGCVLRFSESLALFRTLLSLVGTLHSIRVECQSYLPDWRPEQNYQDSFAVRAIEGGVLLDLIHEIDYACWTFGWPDRIYAKLKNLNRLSIVEEEMAHLSWETGDGCLVSVMIDYLTRIPRRSLRAFGSEGTIEWDGYSNTVTLSIVGVDTEIKRSSQSRNQMFAQQSIAFLRSSSGYQDDRLAPIHEGVYGVAICDAARKSSRIGREQDVSY